MAQDIVSFAASQGVVQPKKKDDILNFAISQGAVLPPPIIPEEQLIEPQIAPGLAQMLEQPIPGYQEERIVETPLPGTPEAPPAPIERPQWAEIGEETLKGTAQDVLEGAQGVFEGAKNVLGMVEAPYSIATGLLAFFPSWATSIVAQLHPDISYAEAEELGNKVAQSIAYMPKTEIGQMGAQTLGKPFELINEGLDRTAEAMAPGDPNSQAVFRTLAWTAVIASAPTIKSGIKQQAVAWKAKGKSLPPEVLETIASQEIQKVAKEKFKFGEKPAGEGIVEPGAPKLKTDAQIAEEAMVQRGGRYIPGARPEVKPKPRIITEYAEEYVAKQNKILQTEAEILKATKKPQKEITEFIENDFMDGAKLREITEDVMAGKTKLADATKEISELIEDTVKPFEATPKDIAIRKAQLEERIVAEKSPLQKLIKKDELRELEEAHPKVKKAVLEEEVARREAEIKAKKAPKVEKESWQITKKKYVESQEKLAQEESQFLDYVEEEVLNKKRPEAEVAKELGTTEWAVKGAVNELIREDVADIDTYTPAYEHKAMVKGAIERGEKVPPEVLADYPELKVTKEAPKVEKLAPEIEAIKTRPLSEKEVAKAKEAGKVEELPPSERKPVSFEEEIGEEYPKAVEEINREIERKQVGKEPKVGGTVEMVEPIPRVGKFKFQDSEIESRFESAKGVPREPLIARARRNLISLKNKATRTYEHLPNTGEFAPAKQELKRLAKQRSVQSYNTLNTLRGITINFRGKPAQMDIFRRKVIMDDLAREAEIGHDLPFGFTKESVSAELSRLDAATKPYKPITDALKQRRRVWDAVTNDYVKYAKKAGVDLEGKLEKPDYFRHQVLEYARAKGISETGKRLRKPGKRGFLKERKGSEFDINTDYFEAEYEVMSQMLYDIEVYKTVKSIEKGYDISKKVRAQAKELELENWKDAIPKGYEVWQPKEGNTFYFADTISSRIAQDIMNDALTDIGVVKDGLKKAMAIGGKRKEWVIKSELAKTLSDLTQRESPSWMGKLNKKILRAWKVWTLTSPRRHPKYNLRNLTGDADAVLVGNARGFKKVPKAISDLYNFYVLDKPMTGEFKEWHNRGGMETTLQAQELGDIKGLKWFKEFSDKKGGVKDIPGNIWKKYWRAARLSTDFREAILRVANYYDYLEQVKAGKGKPKNYGGSIPEEIDALKNPRDKAFRLSNELLGPYDEISVFGQGIREHAYPFWSWKELNFRRYVRLFKNATRDNKTAMGVAKGILPVISRTPVMALKFGRFAIKATAFWSALQVWNHTKFPEEERLLPDNVKGRAHIIFGRDDDGNIVYFSRLGALGDFLEWFGLDAAPQLVSEYLSGKKSIKDIGKHMMRAPVNQVVQGLHPVKGVFEVMLRRSLFPDAFDPKTIRDRGLHLARSMALENEYKAIQGKPGKPYVETLPLFAVYHVDPFESAYHEAFDMKGDYLKKFGKRGEGFWMTPRGSALYDLKMAHRYGDKKAEAKALKDYIQWHVIEAETTGKTKQEVEKSIMQGIGTSLRNMHPLSGMSEKERIAFVTSLDKGELEIMAKAIKFYSEVLLGTSKVEGK